METVVPFRDGELPIKEKRVKKCMILRTFNKNKSVFKNWKEDTPNFLKESFFTDISYSKVQKFTKEPEIYDEVWEVLLKHTSQIKEMFTYGIGISSYPSISWLDFCNMCKDWEIVDKNLTMTTIDRVFIITNVEEVEQEDNPDRDLWRYEFYEIVARLAKEKYHSTKICDSIAEAIDRFVSEIYEVYKPMIWSWQQWREEQLWTIKIDDLLRANLPALNTIYSM